MTYQGELPQNATGLRLCRMQGEELILCEEVQFIGERQAVDTTLRRASISGRVEIGGKNIDHWADVLDKDGSWDETVALDARSYRALKTKWMRCKTKTYATPDHPQPNQDYGGAL